MFEEVIACWDGVPDCHVDLDVNLFGVLCPLKGRSKNNGRLGYACEGVEEVLLPLLNLVNSHIKCTLWVKYLFL